jgi:hypothetical protein
VKKEEPKFKCLLKVKYGSNRTGQQQKLNEKLGKPPRILGKKLEI